MSTVYNIINTAISNRINTKLGLTKPLNKNTMKRQYLSEGHIIKVGETYKNDYGQVKVIAQLDDNHFEVEYISKPLNLSDRFIVYKNGRFGYCWNNPHTLCRL